MCRLAWMIALAAALPRGAAAPPRDAARLPWPFRWLHPPKTGSFFAVAVSDLICDALRAAPGDHGFAKKQGTALPRGRTRCAATGYFGRPVGVSLLPHALAGPELSFADGHYPSTFDGATFAVPTLAWVRAPGPRLRAQFAQGMTRWRAGRGRVVRGRFDARGGSPRGARPRVERASGGDRSPRRGPGSSGAGASEAGTAPPRWCEGRRGDACFDEALLRPLARLKGDACAQFAAWSRIPGVLGCQAKLFLGRPCAAAEAPTAAELAKAEAALADGAAALVFVGDTGDWNRSVCLFYAQSAGRAARAPRTSRRDVASTAAARRFASGACPPDEALLPAAPRAPRRVDACAGAYDAADERLYAAAARRVDRDWARFGRRVSACAACRFGAARSVGTITVGAPSCTSRSIVVCVSVVTRGMQSKSSGCDVNELKAHVA